MPREVQTLLFTDIVASTDRVREMGDAAWTELRRRHYAAIRSILDAHRGREVDTTGDGLLARFDSPTAGVRAAAAIVRDVQDLGLQLRAGLHTGEIELDADEVSGVGVHLGARVMARAAPGEVLVSATVRDLVAGSGMDFIDRGMHELAGFAEPWRLFALVLDSAAEPEPVADAVPPRRRAEWAVPLPAHVVTNTTAFPDFVGREAELAALEAARRSAATRRRVVLVSGEPGVGKTRLTSTLARAAAEEGSVVLYGRSDEDLGAPYRPWVEALGHVVEHAGDDVRATLAGRRLAELSRLLPGALATGDGHPRPVSADAETERYLLFQAVATLLSAIATAKPTVLVLDDLHWADKPTLLLLRHVVAATAELPLLILGTYRDSELSSDHPLTATVAALYRESGVDRLVLSGLGGSGTAALLESIAGHGLDRAGAALAGAIHRETDGNPFFTVEILRHLVESRALYWDREGVWKLRDDLGEVSLPESVRVVVSRRVAHLGEETARTLSAASVIGRDFDLDLLASVMEQSEDEVIDRLDSAVAAAVIKEVPGDIDRYAFTHALVQHTLHDALGAARRRRWHRRVAEALETAYGEEPGERVSELAAHWLAATAPAGAGKALHYARLAGRRALTQLAPDEAARWFAQALELHGTAGPADPTTRADLLIDLGTAQRQAGDPAHRETLLEAAAIAQRLHDGDRLVAAALANNRGYFSATGQLDPERVAVLRAALVAVPTEDSPQRARLLATLAAELTFTSDWEGRRALAQEASAMARRLGDPATRAQVLTLTFYATNVPETLPQRLAQTAEAVTLAAESNDPVASFWAATFRAYASLQACDMVEVDACLERAAGLAERLSQPFLRYWSALNGSWRALLAGRTEEAERLTQEARRIAADAAIPEISVFHVGQLFAIRQHQGRLAEVVDQIAEVAAENPGIPTLRATLATACCDVDRTEEARDLLRAEAATGFSELPYDIFWLHALLRWGDIAAHLGDAEAAAILYERLAPWWEQVTFTSVTVGGPVSHFLGRLAVVLGRFDEAREHLAHATAACERLGAPYFSVCNDLARGRLEGSTELVERARATAERYGFATLERRAAAALAGSGPS